MFALIGWIGRFLLILFVVRLVLRMLFPTPAQKRGGGQTSGGAAPRGPAGARPPKGEIAGGQLVRCAKCGTYVPENTAITAASGSGEQKFCSEACRQAYTAA